MVSISTSVSNLIHELEMRIKLFSSTEVRSNLDPTSFATITSIISKYTKRPPQDIKVEDITLFKIYDMQDLLNSMGVRPNEIDRILIGFNPNVYKYNSNDRSLEVEKFFENIRKMIINYVSDYLDIKTNQKEIKDEKVVEYQKYIDLLSKKQLEEPFEDIEGIMRLMTTLALPNEDKWQILTHVAKLNLTTAKIKEEDIDYNKRITDMVEEYLKDNEGLVNIIQQKIMQDNIDIDLIPTISEEIAEEIDGNKDQVQNIMVTIIASNIYSNYLKESEKDNNESDKYKELLDLVLAQKISKEDEIVTASKEILNDSKALVASEDLKSDEVMRFIDMSTSEIEAEGYTREQALDYKLLPILKTIAETLDKIATLNKEEDDYRICSEILEDLNEAYYTIVEKQDKGLKKN